MTHNTLVLIAIVGKCITTLAAIAGAVYLADQGKAGWGWLIFLAVVLGSFSLKDNA